MNIADTVRNIVTKQLHIPVRYVTMEARLVEDLGADPLDLIELVMALEEKFNIQISKAEGEKLNTVYGIMVYLKHKLYGVDAEVFDSQEGQIHISTFGEVFEQ